MKRSVKSVESDEMLNKLIDETKDQIIKSKRAVAE